MDLKEAAQYIRDTVSMGQILDMYGYTPKHGFMQCPFHSGDRTASLKVYAGRGGWYCYGCGAGGSVIDFVMRHDDCDFRTAIETINGAVELGLDLHGDPLNRYRRRAKSGVFDSLAALLQQQIADAKHDVEINLRIMTQKSCELDSIPKADRTAQEWDQLAILTEEMQYQEYRKDRMDELSEEVRKWRTNKRRAQTEISDKRSRPARLPRSPLP